MAIEKTTLAALTETRNHWADCLSHTGEPCDCYLSYHPAEQPDYFGFMVQIVRAQADEAR
jgi:hypothetical protein